MIEEFSCKMCDFVEEYSNYDAPDECPQCHHRLYTLRYIKNIRIKPKFVSIGYKDTPRYSASLGVSETQIEDAVRLHPGTEWKKFGYSYRPLIRNRTDKKRLMKEADFEEYSPKDFKGRDR